MANFQMQSKTFQGIQNTLPIFLLHKDIMNGLKSTKFNFYSLGLNWIMIAFESLDGHLKGQIHLQLWSQTKGLDLESSTWSGVVTKGHPEHLVVSECPRSQAQTGERLSVSKDKTQNGRIYFGLKWALGIYELNSSEKNENVYNSLKYH